MTTTSRDLRDMRAFLLDMDGTLIVSDRLLPGAAEFVALLKERELPHVFLTNNSSARGSHFHARLVRLGIAAAVEDVFTSGEATARWLREHTPHRRLLLLGTPDLQAEFREYGFDVPDPDVAGDDADAVVIGFDKTLAYPRFERAALLLAKGVPYYATHPDYTCITDRGLIPDVGCIAISLEKVTGRVPQVIGKPERPIAEAALSRLGTDAAHTAMVGDQLDTDMTMAARAGLFGVLLLSGETSREKLESQDAIRPARVYEHIGELYEELRAL